MSSIIEYVSAAASCGAAAGTFAMAIMTRESINRNEKHHMDDSRPILMIYSSSGKNLEEQENRKMMISCPVNKIRSNNKITLIIDGCVENIGKGIAKNIKINIKFCDNERMILVHECQPIKPGESKTIGESFFRSRLKEHSDFVDEYNNFKESYYESICKVQYAWVISIIYEDIYGREFFTTHDLSVENEGKGLIPWAQFPDTKGSKNA